MCLIKTLKDILTYRFTDYKKYFYITFNPNEPLYIKKNKNTNTRCLSYNTYPEYSSYKRYIECNENCNNYVCENHSKIVLNFSKEEKLKYGVYFLLYHTTLYYYPNKDVIVFHTTNEYFQTIICKGIIKIDTSLKNLLYFLNVFINDNVFDENCLYKLKNMLETNRHSSVFYILEKIEILTLTHKRILINRIINSNYIIEDIAKIIVKEIYYNIDFLYTSLYMHKFFFERSKNKDDFNYVSNLLYLTIYIIYKNYMSKNTPITILTQKVNELENHYNQSSKKDLIYNQEDIERLRTNFEKLI